MKKALSVVIVLAVIAGLALFVFRTPVKEAIYDGITADMFVPADTDSFDPGPAVGSSFPGVRALYQGQEISLLNSLTGTNGTVLVASRSLDWCPFCMKQMIQLNTHKEDFDAAGIAVIGITYDSPALLDKFAAQHAITLPLLSDIEVMTFKTLGIVNAEYTAGDDAYGIPYPGMIVIDPDGIVVGKLFLEGYSTRVDSLAALAFAKQVLAVTP
ncbi:MAG: peroxiredoxin family protein [Halioglobus sp.]